MHPRRSCWTPTCSRRDTTITGSAPWRSRRIAHGWRFARTPSAGANSPCASRICAPAKFSPAAIPDVESDLAWANDNRTLLYVEKDPETLLGLYVKKHVLGTDPRHDALVFEQTDKSFYTGVSKSKSERFIFIHMESTVSSEWRYAHADDPALEFKTFLPHERDHEYQLEHLGDDFIVRTNWQARNFRLMRVPIGREASRADWQDVVAHRDDTFIEDFDVFNGFLAVVGAQRRPRQDQHHAPDPACTRAGGGASTQGAAEFFIASDEAAYATSLSVNPELDTELVRYAYSSLTTPDDGVRLQRAHRREDSAEARSGARQLRSRRTIDTEFLFAPARDGAQIPVSLVYRKDFVRDGSAPLLQYAYGAYGLSTDPSFSSARLSLIDRGFVYAIAHVRGGQEMGRAWYDDGRKLHKMNSFTDFIDVTRHLVAERYAAKDKVFAMGGSAGGLLMGAVANLSPGDYRGIVAQVPFVDVVTTMLDDSIPLTTNEYDEWGNPGERADYDYMLSYSPYDNVRAQALSGHVRHHRPMGQPGAVLRAGQMGRQAARARRPTRIPCSCTSTWKPVTAASPGASSAIGRSRWNTPFCWTRPAPTAAFETSIRTCRQKKAPRAGEA